MNLTTMIAGTAVTSVLFISLFGMVALIMNSAMAHTDTMLGNMNNYANNPTEENKAQLESSIDDTNKYMKQMSSMSSAYLKKYLDSIDSSILSEEDKKSIEQAKELLDSIEAEEITDPEVIEMQNKLNRIFDKLEEIENEE